MRAFHFKLQAVLDQRQRQEELAQRDYALALKELQDAQQIASDHEKQIREALMSQSATLGMVDIRQVIANRRFVITLEQELGHAIQQVTAMQKEADKKQKILARASQRKQALSRLKERQYDNWYRDFLRRDQIEVDEVAGQVGRRKGF